MIKCPKADQKGISKMKINKKYRLLSLLTALLLLSSCGNTDTVTADTSDTTSAFETVVSGGEEQTENAVFEAKEFTADSGSFSAKFESVNNFDGEIALSLKSGDEEFSDSKKITLKAGEVCEFTGENVSFLSSDFTLTLSPKPEGGKAEELKIDFKKGLVQLSESSVELVVDAMTIQEKASLLVSWPAEKALAANTFAIERLGVPSIQFADGPAGLRVSTATIGYPSGTSLACTWNDETVRKITEYIGDDCAAYGVEILLAPGMNIQKEVLGGRNFEYFSEDPYLTGMMASAYTLGIQSKGVGVSLKHYAANNQETSRGSVSAKVTERALREIYLKAFDYAVELSEPYTVMTSYNKVNGKYTSVHKNLINVLRSEFGFDGCVLSDWEAGGTRDGMINAGNDMYCGSKDPQADVKNIVNAISLNKAKKENVDLCCENILRLVAKTGATFKNDRFPMQPPDKRKKLTSVREAGAEGMVLLKNDDGTLPINNTTVALFGNASYVTEHGGYGAGSVMVGDVKTVYEGLAGVDGISVNGEIATLYRGCQKHPHVLTPEANPVNDPLEVVITRDIAKKAAEESEYAIFTVSRMTMEGADHTNTFGDFKLNSIESDTLKYISEEFHAKGKKVIVLINTGNPIEVASWEDMADAILYIGLAGEQIGNSTADILTGAVNPSGKLTSTWPLLYSDTPCSEYFPGNTTETVYYDDIYVGYRYYKTFDIPVAYEFGYGLSYTSFEYSDFTVTEGNDGITLSVKVKNTGDLSGNEVVQFYVTKPDGKNEHPVLELTGYGKTSLLKPGEEEVITVKVTDKELMTYVTSDSAWIVEKGEYKFSVGASVNDIKFEKALTRTEEALILDTENVCSNLVKFDIITKETPKKVQNTGENFALGKPVKASGAENGCDAEYAVDGSAGTRWSGLGTQGDTYWITVDLGEVKEISSIAINWESNAKEKFSVKVSSDGENWKTLEKVKYSAVTEHKCRNTGARFVRVEGPAGGFFSIYEISVYGK